MIMMMDSSHNPPPPATVPPATAPTPPSPQPTHQCPTTTTAMMLSRQPESSTASIATTASAQLPQNLNLENGQTPSEQQQPQLQSSTSLFDASNSKLLLPESQHQNIITPSTSSPQHSPNSFYQQLNSSSTLADIPSVANLCEATLSTSSESNHHHLCLLNNKGDAIDTIANTNEDEENGDDHNENNHFSSNGTAMNQPEGLERIAKMLSGGNDNNPNDNNTSAILNPDEASLANASQLLAAAVAAATVAASGNLAALSPQEQWLASMAPTLLQMFSSGQNLDPSAVPGSNQMNQEDSESSNSSSDNSESENDEPSSLLKNNRKQNNPVRFDDDHDGGDQPSDGLFAKKPTAKKPSRHSRNSKSSSSSTTVAQQASSLFDGSTAGGINEGEEEGEEEEPSGDVEGRRSEDEEEEEEGDGRQQTQTAKKQRSRSTRRPAAAPTTAGQQLQSATTTTADEAERSATTTSEDDEVLREKQQQLLLANMFASLQQKLISSVFCPHCNAACASEEQLRAHIEFEHLMGKDPNIQNPVKSLNFFSTENNSNTSETAHLHLKQLAEHLAMQQKLQELQAQHQQQQVVDPRKRKRKLGHHQNPSSPGGSVSSLDSADSTADSDSARLHPFLDEEEEEAQNLRRPQQKNGPKQRRNSKDLNHNSLLQSLSSLSSPLISSLNGNGKPATATSPGAGPHSPATLLQLQQQQQGRPTSSSPFDLQHGNFNQQISPSGGDPRASPSSSAAAASAAALASIFPPGMAPFLFPQLLSQAGGNGALPPGFREHLSQQFGPNSNHPLQQQLLHHQQQQQQQQLHHSGQSGPMLNGVPVAPGNSSAAAAAAAAASLRIFNPEAYCELCNKEFCNKYFLKTHKANKHGIYTPDAEGRSGGGGGNSGSSGDERRTIPLPANSSSLMPPTSMSGGSGSLNLGLSLPMSSMMGPSTNGHHPQHLQHSNNSSNNSSSSSKASPNNHSSSLMHPTDSFGNSSSTSPGLLPGFPGGPMRLNLNLNMINLDSYCEICQKEFCNKYFLKKHKQKIHGYIYNGDTAIPPPNLAAQIAAAAQQPNHPAQLQQLQQLQMLQHQMQLQQQQMRSSPDLGEGGKTSPSPSTNGNGSNQPQLSVLTSSDKTAAGINTSQTSASETGGASSSTSATSGIPSAPGAMAPEKLRSMGVINADAFCEICCKEFCNKYFLRTHKINKHGLLDGQSISTRFPVENRLTAGNGNGRTGQPFMFNSSNLNSANDSGMEPGQRDPASYGKNSAQFLGAFTSSSSDNSAISVTCELCADQAHSFPSTYLLNVHKAYYHDIPYASLNGGGEENNELEEGETPRRLADVENKQPKDQYTFDHEEANNNDDSDAEAEVGSCNVPPSLLVSAELNVDGCQDGTSQSSMKSSNSVAKESTGGNGQEQQQDQLQKLHSMIKGLMPGGGDMNDGEGDEDHEDGERPQNGGEGDKVSCHICKFDCENRYYLRAHLINEHGFPPTEEAFIAMLNATAGLNFLDQSSPSNFGSPNFKGDGSLPGLGMQSGNGNGSSEAYCELCNKEFCSKYFLKTHKARIHNIHEPNSAGSPSPSNSNSGMGDQGQNQLPPALLSSLYQAAALQQQQQQSAKSQQQQGKFNPSHHPSSSNSPSSIQATIKAALAAGLVPGGPDGGPHPMQMPPNHHGPSSSGKSSSSSRAPVMTGRNYCNICNKELCNKYFMKTHMLKMHNINIDEHPIEAQQSSTIGGVTCDICQKELCSKYFLKVHKQNTHGIYEDGAAPPVLLGPSGASPQGMGFPGGNGSNGSRGGNGSRSKTGMHPSAAAALLQQQQQNLGPDSINPMLLMSMMQSAAAAQAAAAQAAAVQAAASSAINDAASSDSNLSAASTSSASDREAKLHGLDPVADAGHRLLPSFTESCQLCDRRFKSVKWLKAHMMADHAEVLAMMRTGGELSAAFVGNSGNNPGAQQQLETLGRLCFVCGQMFADRLTMHIHLVKEHKVSGEELAMNLAGNLKMAALMAAVAGNGQNGQQEGNASEERQTPLSRASTPSSPKPPNAQEGMPAALQQLLLAKQSGMPINPMALLAASAAQSGGNPWAMQAAMMEFEAAAAAAAAADPNFQHLQQLQQLQQQQQQQQQQLQLQQQQQQQHQFNSPAGVFTSPTGPAAPTVTPTGPNRPSGHGNTKNPPGKFVCNQCFRTYRHSHSLQRHILASHKKPAAAAAAAATPATTPPSSSSSIMAVPPPTLFSKIADGPIGPPPPTSTASTSAATANSAAGVGGDGQPAKPRNKRYRCSKCNKKFRTRELCLVHIRALHSITANNSNSSSATTTKPASPSQLPSAAPANFTSPRSVASTEQPLALNLRTSTADDHQHPLPPSPSVSSEDDLLNHQQQLQQLQQQPPHHPLQLSSPVLGGGPKMTESSTTSTYLPQSPLEEEDHQDKVTVPSVPPPSRNLPTTSEALAQKILNLSTTAVPPPPPPVLTDHTETSVAASPESQPISRPSLICVNGEKF